MCRLEAFMGNGSFGIRVFGLRIRIRPGSFIGRDRILQHLPPGWTTDSADCPDRCYEFSVGRGTQARYRLHADGALLYFHSKIEEVLRWFESDLQIYVAEMSKDLVFVHAGVVGWQGRALIVPGRRFTGKTTLLRALLDAGAEFYSDRYAVFDRDGRVYPYVAGQTAEAEPLPPGMIVATYYAPGAEWRPRRISEGCALLLLFANTASARSRPDVALATLRRVSSGTLALESARGEAAKTAEVLLAQMSETGQMASSSSSSSCF